MRLRHQDVSRRQSVVAGAVLAGLLLDCPANGQALQTTPPPAAVCTNGYEPGSQPVRKGDKFVFDLYKRPFNSFDVLEADGIAVKADESISLPVCISKKSVASIKLAVRGFDLLCASSFFVLSHQEIMPRLIETESGPVAAEAFKRIDCGRPDDNSARIARYLNDNLDAFLLSLMAQKTESTLLRQTFSGPFKYGYPPTVLSGGQDIFRVVSQDDKEAVIEVNTLALGTQRVVLDKKTDMEVRFKDVPAFMTVPYQIGEISVGKDGRFKVAVAPDRSR